MTIVYCIFSLAPAAGMQRVLTVKANYLADVAGHSVHVVTSGTQSGESHFPLSSRVRVYKTGRAYRKELTKLLRVIRPDITISLYGPESRWLYKINDGSKKVIEFHFTRNHLVHLVRGLPHVRFRGLRLMYVRILQYLDERCAPHYDRLVLLTEADRRIWGEPANAVVIPNPLSFSSPVRSDLSARRILSVGRLIASKGFDLLIEAYRTISIKHPDWKLSIIGEGQDKQYLLNMIRHYGMEEQVEILPPTADITAEMLKSSIYALPSRYEGFGLVITEAMECGIPCVAFDCECGPNEIISDGVDGILVAPENTVKFKQALLRLIESGELRSRLGDNARISARRFSPEKIMERWEALFHSLVHNPPVDV